MEPVRFGRTIGIGMRVASKILRDRAARAGQENVQPAAGPVRPRPATPPVWQPVPTASDAYARTSRRAVEKTRAVGRGTKKFGQAFWGPFTHAGSVLWLEITGMFFAFFAAFFAQNVYRVHGAWKQGTEHTHFLLYIALAAAFVWFSASSFLRARRKSKRTR